MMVDLAGSMSATAIGCLSSSKCRVHDVAGRVKSSWNGLWNRLASVQIPLLTGGKNCHFKPTHHA
jgi:hypothetical protein